MSNIGSESDMRTRREEGEGTTEEGVVYIGQSQKRQRAKEWWPAEESDARGGKHCGAKKCAGPSGVGGCIKVTRASNSGAIAQ